MIRGRRCGILMHLSSLPGRFGCGDLGTEAYRFAEFLARAGMRDWQMLPVNPIDAGCGWSPYSSTSAFAGNTLFISPQLLVNAHLLPLSEIRKFKPVRNRPADYHAAQEIKSALLHASFYRHFGDIRTSEEYKLFCQQNNFWLESFAIFTVLHSKFRKSWSEWPEIYRTAGKGEFEGAVKALRNEVDREKYFQFLFFLQWNSLRKYCAELNVSLIGDMPFYVSHDSADVWSNREIFQLDENGSSINVAGVPPDYFSSEGQRWGMPVYDWHKLKETSFKWWKERAIHNLQLFDQVRLDHFRAFANYWEIPATHGTAMNGRWVETPGREFFQQLRKKKKNLNFIAEDLGDAIGEDVHRLMRDFGFPGLKVLQFAFGDDVGSNPYSPHNYTRDFVVYPGTHDNKPCRSWFLNLGQKQKQILENYLGKKVSERTVSGAMIQLALASVADQAIVQMQDFLNLGDSGIMNIPGDSHGNWQWRMKSGGANAKLAQKLQELVRSYGRY